MGRPVIYKPEYCDMLIKHMAQGKSFTTFGAVVGVSRHSLYDWVSEYDDFADAKEQAMKKSQEWFEQRLQAKLLGVKSPNFDPKLIDATVLIFALKTRFHEFYGDKSDGDGGRPVNIFIDGKKINEEKSEE